MEICELLESCHSIRGSVEKKIRLESLGMIIPKVLKYNYYLIYQKIKYYINKHTMYPLSDSGPCYECQVTLVTGRKGLRTEQVHLLDSHIYKAPKCQFRRKTFFSWRHTSWGAFLKRVLQVMLVIVLCLVQGLRGRSMTKGYFLGCSLSCTAPRVLQQALHIVPVLPGMLLYFQMGTDKNIALYK